MELTKGLFLLLGLAAAATVAVQFALNVDSKGGVGPALVSLTGYFTIWTNLAVALTGLHIGLARQAWSQRQVSLATSMVLFTAFVGFVYHLLLADRHNPQGIAALTNVMLHYVIPASTAALWLWKVPKGTLPWRAAVLWCGFPLTYLVFALIRGQALGSYPYFFLNLNEFSALRVGLNTLGLTAAFLVLGLALIATDRALSRNPRPSRA